MFCHKKVCPFKGNRNEEVLSEYLLSCLWFSKNGFLWCFKSSNFCISFFNPQKRQIQKCALTEPPHFGQRTLGNLNFSKKWRGKGFLLQAFFFNSNWNRDCCDDVTQSKIDTSGDFVEVNNWWKFSLNPTCTDKEMKRQKSPISRQYYLKLGGIYESCTLANIGSFIVFAVTTENMLCGLCTNSR